VSDPSKMHYFTFGGSHAPVSDPPKMHYSTFGGSNTHMIVLDEGVFYYYNSVMMLFSETARIESYGKHGK